jgi:hypothetical protein
MATLPTLQGPFDWLGATASDDAAEIVGRMEESDVPIRSHGSLSPEPEGRPAGDPQLSEAP